MRVTAVSRADRFMNRNLLTGLLLALISSAAFGTSGALAKGLLTAGWSPAAAVTWRVAIGAVMLSVPAALAMRGRWQLLRRGWPTMLLFGVIAVAGCQLAYFLAVERLSVAIALLLEYCGVILVVLWLWLRHGQRPRPLTVIGTAIAVAGLLLVLDVFGAVQVDPLGVMWGLLAAAGLATYFIVSADESHSLPPLALAAGGLLVGTVTLLLAGTIGLVSLEWNTAPVLLAGQLVPWWLDVALLGVVAAALSYLTGVAGTRRLGSKLASFVGLSEVLFAVLWAWLLLGELPVAIQLVGGVLLLAGVAAGRLDESRPPGANPAEPLTAANDRSGAEVTHGGPLGVPAPAAVSLGAEQREALAGIPAVNPGDDRFQRIIKQVRLQQRSVQGRFLTQVLLHRSPHDGGVGAARLSVVGIETRQGGSQIQRSGSRGRAGGRRVISEPGQKLRNREARVRGSEIMPDGRAVDQQPAAQAVTEQAGGSRSLSVRHFTPAGSFDHRLMPHQLTDDDAPLHVWAHAELLRPGHLLRRQRVKQLLAQHRTQVEPGHFHQQQRDRVSGRRLRSQHPLDAQLPADPLQRAVMHVHRMHCLGER